MADNRTRIQLCGRLVAELEGRRVEGELPGRQGRLLFTYLVLNRHRPVSRAELAEALWPEAPGQADAGLRPLVSKLRRGLGQDLLSGRGDLRLLLPADAWVDVDAAREAVHRAESAVEQGQWRRAWGPAQVAMFAARRELLAGESAPWLEQERWNLEALELRALEAYAAACLGIGGTELRAAERVGQRLIEREPYRESGHRLLMRALAAGGNAAQAPALYDRLRLKLREDLGIAPSPETQTLHRQLLGSPEPARAPLGH